MRYMLIYMKMCRMQNDESDRKIEKRIIFSLVACSSYLNGMFHLSLK